MSWQEDFINTIGPMIRQVAMERGYKVASPIIAQATVESFKSSGLSQLAAKYHNYFGMKCGSGWIGKSVNLSTKEEYTKGTLTNIKANFRVYDSMLEGVRGYFDFINTPRYSNLKTATTPQQYLEMIKADGYATSSTYVATNMSRITKYDLTRFDNFSMPDDMQGKDVRRVIAVNLNARMQPMGTVLFKLCAGDQVNVVEEKDGWCKTECWVSSKYLVK